MCKNTTPARGGTNFFFFLAWHRSSRGKMYCVVRSMCTEIPTLYLLIIHLLGFQQTKFWMSFAIVCWLTISRKTLRNKTHWSAPINQSFKLYLTYFPESVSAATSCPPLASIAGGSVSYQSTSRDVGSFATISCQSGYRLVGASRLNCLSSGAWSSASTTCREWRENLCNYTFLFPISSLADILYLSHERVTKKMTIMVSPTFRHIHLLQREIVKGTAADLRGVSIKKGQKCRVLV